MYMTVSPDSWREKYKQMVLKYGGKQTSFEESDTRGYFAYYKCLFTILFI